MAIAVMNVPAVLPEAQQISLEILSNLSVDHLNQIKARLSLGNPGIIGPETIQEAAILFKKKFALTRTGVSAFKAAQGLGDGGDSQGVIGPETAERYFQLSSDSKAAAVVAAAANIADRVYETDGCAHAVSDAIIAAGFDSWLTGFLSTHNLDTISPGSRMWTPNYAGIGEEINDPSDLQPGDIIIYNFDGGTPSLPRRITTAPAPGGGIGWDHIGIVADDSTTAYNVSSANSHRFIATSITSFQIGYRI